RLSIKNTTSTLLETNLKPFLEKLRNRNQIEPQIPHKSNFSQGKQRRKQNRADTQHLTLTVVPECDVLLGAHGVEAGEPSAVPCHVPRATGVHDPYVLQASILQRSTKARVSKRSDTGVRKT